MSGGPLIVQSDRSLLLEVDHELAEECRAAITPFVELEKAPEHVHTLRRSHCGPAFQNLDELIVGIHRCSVAYKSEQVNRVFDSHLRTIG